MRLEKGTDPFLVADPFLVDQRVKRRLHLWSQWGRVARIDNGLLNQAQLLGFGLLLGHISFHSRTAEYASHTKILTGSAKFK
jgi:hypothetical protein